MLPLAIIFFIAIVAETNRAPFDLPEAEGELVAGFNLEYGSMVFSFFFLAEYANIILMSTFYSLIFLGGWLNFNADINSSWYIDLIFITLKILFICNMFLMIRSVLPRYRYDQLMFLCWKCFLPFVFSYSISLVFIYLFFDVLPSVRHFEFQNIIFFLYSDHNLLGVFTFFCNSYIFFKKWIWDFGSHLIIKKDDPFWLKILKLVLWVHLFSGGGAILLKMAGVSYSLIGMFCSFYFWRILYILSHEFWAEFTKTKKKSYLIISLLCGGLLAYFLMNLILFIISILS